MNKKRTLLILLIAGLASAPSLNASQGPRCQGGQCARGQLPEGHRAHHGERHRGYHHERPIWKEVQGNRDQIEVNEHNTWVLYQKSNTNCPQVARHHHPHWQSHQHGEHHHGQGHHGHHKSHRRVKYQRNQNGDKIDGVLNVQEGGTCWEYKRTFTTRSILAADRDFIERMEQSLEIE